MAQTRAEVRQRKYRGWHLPLETYAAFSAWPSWGVPPLGNAAGAHG